MDDDTKEPMNHIREINKGDVLTFRASDNKFKLMLCTSVYKERSPFNYTFAALTYTSETTPTFENIINSEFYGIGHCSKQYCTYTNAEINKIWTIHPEIKPFFLGSYGLIIWRKDFLKFRNNFKLICNLNIVDNLDKNGSGATNSSTLAVLDAFFVTKLSILENERGQQRFKIKAILKE